MSQSASSSLTDSLSGDESGESGPVEAEYRTKEVLSTIKNDLEKLVHCDFDDFLRYFLSLCLDGKDKERFEQLQTSIEQLQDRHSQDNITAFFADDNKLVAERDEFLDDIFQQCLLKILVIANDPMVKGQLEDFSMSRSHPTPEGRKRYVVLCNHVLELMQDLKDLPLRKKGGLDLRVSCANHYEHHGEVLEFVRTSRHAAVSVRSTSTDTSTDASFGEAPEAGFSPSQILSCDKVISFKLHISAEAAAVLQPGGRFGIKRRATIFYDQYYNVIVRPSFGHPVASSSTQPGLKRTHSGEDNDLLSNKRHRQNLASEEYTAPMPSFMQHDIPIAEDEVARAHPLDKAEVNSVAYAMEMLSYGVGINHVINTVIADEYLWIWYHDRQGIIRSNGISVIADFPRFLFLLFLFQRFTPQDWGIVPCLNGEALVRHGLRGQRVPRRAEGTHAPSLDNNVIRLELEGDHFSHTQRETLMQPLRSPILIHADKYLSRKPRCIVGSATSVFEADCGGIKLACKIYSPEAERRHEGLISRLVRAIATRKNPAMLRHLPELYFAGDFRRCSTMRVRSMLKLSVRCYRALRIIVLPKLDPVTKLDAESFVNAWLDVVTCHAFLWKHGVEHGDPSLSNVMYHPIRQCGVISDLDLAAIQWLPMVPGTDRTGTIPYMALDLLCQEYWDGGVKRYYHHELEAFIWILVFVFFCFKDHKLETDNTFNRRFCDTADLYACMLFKESLLRTISDFDSWVQDDFTGYTGLLKELCLVVQSSRRDRTVTLESEGTGLINGMSHDTHIKLHLLDHVEVSTNIWDSFISVLDKFRLESFQIKFNKPDFGHIDDKVLFDEMAELYNVLLNEVTSSNSISGTY